MKAKEFAPGQMFLFCGGMYFVQVNACGEMMVMQCASWIPETPFDDPVDNNKGSWMFLLKEYLQPFDPEAEVDPIPPSTL